MYDIPLGQRADVSLQLVLVKNVTDVRLLVCCPEEGPFFSRDPLYRPVYPPTGRLNASVPPIRDLLKK